MPKRKLVQTEGPQAITRIKVVKRGVEYRGNRAAWYAVLQRHDGEPVEKFLRATSERPPALTKKGEAENPKGWIRFFRRTGVAQLRVEGGHSAD
jgi:hypothetical protein